MKLSGYRVSHRNRWLLLTNEILSLQGFLLFEYYLDSMDFDIKHENYGLFEAYPDEIAECFNNKKKETIKAWHNGLLTKGFIEIADKQRRLFRIKSPARYRVSCCGKASEFAKDEKRIPSLDFFLENICFYPEKAKIKSPKKANLALKDTSKALGSSKGDYRLSSDSSKKIGIIEQVGEQEKDIVEIFFDSDWDKYQKSLDENNNLLTDKETQ